MTSPGGQAGAGGAIQGGEAAGNSRGARSEPATQTESQGRAEKTANCPVGKDGTSKCDRGHNSTGAGPRFSKRDVSLTEKYVELALVLSQDMFDKRNSSSRLEVLHDAIQIVNCLDLYFRSANTRVALIYVETWAHGDQIEMSSDVKQTLYNFLEYSTRKLYKVPMDAVHLLSGGHGRQFEANEVGMSIPDSICSSRAVSVSQEASVFEPFITASTLAHMLGHNLGMEHDEQQAVERPGPQVVAAAAAAAATDGDGGRPAELGGSQRPTGAGRPLELALRQGGQAQHQTGSQDQEEHEDEIKSRSLDPTEAELPIGLRSGANMATLASHCRANCLMSERFTYLQPPVSFGNMILQQVASHSNQSASGSFVTMFSVGQEQSLNANQPEQPQIQLNGPTQTQIEAELQNERLLASSLPFKFSRRSIDTYHQLLRLGHGICLFNKPNQLEDFKTCGNGIVDRGEDCDCGTFRECLENDSCCDPITCRFKADAECINGACCDRCKLRPKGFVCRRARGECDLAEICDGKSGQCAPDVHKQNGFPCSTNQGYCYLGQCPTHDGQCSDLWGSDSRKSDRLCYSSFNANGTIRGNCGQEASTRKFKRCEQDNIMCGTLQCQLGDMKPVTAPLDPIQATNNPNLAASQLSIGGSGSASATRSHEFSKKILHSNDGSHHECKVITGPAAVGPQASSIAYVRDGSKCAQNRVCYNQTCQPIELVYRDSFELCPRDERGQFCSANGVCSTANRCHCEPGWIGHDCSQRSEVKRAQASGQESDRSRLLKHSGISVDTSELVSAQTYPARTLNLPVNVLDQQTAPSVSGQTLPNGAPNATKPELVAQEMAQSTTTETATTAATITTQTTQTPPPVVSPSNVVLDKKKHDALGAPTLVFILVSIVAAVYVGFALMANCYRRKGFIKPDKVLRHHQMNCKLDAIRSSFIAKRLADAEAAASTLDLNSNAPHMNGNIQNRLDLLTPFVSPLSAQPPCQHLNQIYTSDGSRSGPELGLNQAVNLERNQTFEQPLKGFMSQHQQGAQASGRQGLTNQQFAATVHYFEDRPGCQQTDARECMYQRDAFNFEPETSDHVPLLMGTVPEQQVPSTRTHRCPVNRVVMQSFKGFDQQQQQDVMATHEMQKRANVIYQDQWANSLHSNATTRVAQQVSQRAHRLTGSTNPASRGQINRATSLGNVNGQGKGLGQGCKQADEYDDNEDMRASMSDANRALATPLRAHQDPRRLVLVDNYYRGANIDDSCSAPSSPEHRDPCWSDMERRKQSLSRQSSASRIANAATKYNTGYHEEAILGALSNPKSSLKRELQQSLRQRSFEQMCQAANAVEDDDDDDNDDEFPPLPPPPPLSQGGQPLDASCEAESEDDSEPTMASIQSQVRQRSSDKRQSEPSLSEARVGRSPPSTSLFMKTVKRVPLNGGDIDGSTRTERMSLIAQLQHLEQMQSLHQKQIAGEKKVNSNESGLHEFFSLPLSVQLSALLALNLRDNCEPTINTPIDDYLNTLNNSSVATSSRRSFKGSGQLGTSQAKEQQAGSRGGTLKRQQMKLHNLQSLIDRLQQLHSQTMLQQHLDELGGSQFDDSDPHRAYGQSTLNGRRAKSGQRANQTADDLFAIRQQQPLRGSQVRRPVRSRDAVISKNESVYSMSDSEDGAFVSRMLVSYQKIECNTTASEPARAEAETDPTVDKTPARMGGNTSNDRQNFEQSTTQSSSIETTNNNCEARSSQDANSSKDMSVKLKENVT